MFELNSETLRLCKSFDIGTRRNGTLHNLLNRKALDLPRTGLYHHHHLLHLLHSLLIGWIPPHALLRNIGKIY